MNTANGYEELMRLMADFSSSYLDPVLKGMEGESHELLPDQFSTIFHGFTEIRDALDTLTLMEELLRVAPPRSNRIDKDNYLKFLVGSYLQEVYILEQRLSAYAKKLSRLYREPLLPSAVQRVVFDPLEGIINTRGAHVHQRRFTDERLDMVSTMALFKRLGHELGGDLEFEYKFAQQEWRKRIKENNRVTYEIVSQFCELVKAVICKDGKIFFPDSRH